MTDPSNTFVASEIARGTTIASLRLVERIAEGERIECWKGTWPDGGEGTAHVLYRGASARERENFLAGARKLAAAMRTRPMPGVSSIAAVAPSELAYITRASVTGTMADVPVLRWGIDQTVRFVGQLCRAMREVHIAGLTHGCARPANVLLDDDLRPLITDVGMLKIEDSYEGPSDMRHDYAAYTGREVRIGHPATPQSDIFSLGRLMYYALHGEDPDEADEDLPVLTALQYAPPGLVRIIRGCTARDPSRRYPSVDKLLDDLDRYHVAGAVGLQHPHGPEAEGEVDRQSLTPTSDRPPPPRAAFRSTSDEDRVSTTGRHRALAPSRPGASPRPVPSARPAAPSRPPAPAASPAGRVARAPLDTWIEPDDNLLSTGQRRVAVVFGALLLSLALVYSYLRGGSTLAMAVSVVGAVALSLGVPTIGPSPLLSRAVAAVLLGVGMWMVDPQAMVGEWMRTDRMASGTPAERGGRIRDLYARGERNFSALDLRSTDFGSLDLSGARFDNTDLRGAVFARTSLRGASFVSAQVAGTDFSGADLAGVDTTVMTDWVSARCDAGTTMPNGWRCDENKPASTNEVGVTGVTGASSAE